MRGLTNLESQTVTRDRDLVRTEKMCVRIQKAKAITQRNRTHLHLLTSSSACIKTSIRIGAGDLHIRLVAHVHVIGRAESSQAAVIVVPSAPRIALAFAVLLNWEVV